MEHLKHWSGHIFRFCPPCFQSFQSCKTRHRSARIKWRNHQIKRAFTYSYIYPGALQRFEKAIPDEKADLVAKEHFHAIHPEDNIDVLDEKSVWFPQTGFCGASGRWFCFPCFDRLFSWIALPKKTIFTLSRSIGSVQNKVQEWEDLIMLTKLIIAVFIVY